MMISGVAMGTKNVESRFLTIKNEERLATGLRKAFISDNPNPSREGCPDPKTLRDLAFHKRIGNPETFERVTSHMADCSACVQDALGYAEEYRQGKTRRRAVPLALALVVEYPLVVKLGALK